jgi:hypothetical protein
MSVEIKGELTMAELNVGDLSPTQREVWQAEQDYWVLTRNKDVEGFLALEHDRVAVWPAGWAVRKLREMLPRVREDRLHADLAEMLRSHEVKFALANDVTGRAT